MNNVVDVTAAVAVLRDGGVIAYPTEAVYGLGCDAFNRKAVLRIACLKQRPLSKGFVVIASEWSQVSDWVAPLDEMVLQRVFAAWPGPVNWVLPVNKHAPAWVCGDHASVAIRLSAHPVAKALCDQMGGPLISTSANSAGEPPLRNLDALRGYFADGVDAYVAGALGGAERPCVIYDAVTGQCLRD